MNDDIHTCTTAIDLSDVPSCQREAPTTMPDSRRQEERDECLREIVFAFVDYNSTGVFDRYKDAAMEERLQEIEDRAIRQNLELTDSDRNSAAGQGTALGEADADCTFGEGPMGTGTDHVCPRHGLRNYARIREWKWLSFINPSIANGSQFVGAAIVGNDYFTARLLGEAWRLTDGGVKVLMAYLPYAEPPEKIQNRLLNKAEAQKWAAHSDWQTSANRAAYATEVAKAAAEFARQAAQDVESHSVADLDEIPF